MPVYCTDFSSTLKKEIFPTVLSFPHTMAGFSILVQKVFEFTYCEHLL